MNSMIKTSILIGLITAALTSGCAKSSSTAASTTTTSSSLPSQISSTAQ